MYHYLAKLPLYHNKTMPFLLLHHHPYNNLPQFLSTNPTANYPDSFYHVLALAAMHSPPATSHEAPPDEEFAPTAAMHCQDIHPYTSLPYQKHWIRSSLRKNLTVHKRTKAQDITVFHMNMFFTRLSLRIHRILLEINIHTSQRQSFFPISHNAICLRIRNNCTAECYEQYYTSLHNPCIYN